MEMEIKQEDEEGLTIDDTSEFVNGITLEIKREPKVLVIPTIQSRATSDPPDAMEEDQEEEELEQGEVDVKEEEEMQAALLALEGLYGDTKPEERDEEPDGIEVYFLLAAAKVAIAHDPV